jgi:hypothetical protein
VSGFTGAKTRRLAESEERRAGCERPSCRKDKLCSGYMMIIPINSPNPLPTGTTLPKMNISTKANTTPHAATPAARPSGSSPGRSSPRRRASGNVPTRAGPRHRRLQRRRQGDILSRDNGADVAMWLMNGAVSGFLYPKHAVAARV